MTITTQLIEGQKVPNLAYKRRFSPVVEQFATKNNVFSTAFLNIWAEQW
jgi:hypothetical protein